MGTALAAPVLDLGALAIAPAHRRASFGGEDLYLSDREYTLLAALAAAPGRVFCHEELLAEAFAGAPGVGRRAIERYAERASRKLALRGGGLRVESVAGVGLRLAPVVDGNRPESMSAAFS
jgi:DNA-binding response OmpR family regulator